MKENIYPCWCHVCGRIYEQSAIFMSGGSTKKFADGSSRLIRACDSHQNNGVIQRAFIHYQATGKCLPFQEDRS